MRGSSEECIVDANICGTTRLAEIYFLSRLLKANYWLSRGGITTISLVLRAFVIELFWGFLKWRVSSIKHL